MSWCFTAAFMPTRQLWIDAEARSVPGNAKLAAALSLLLWTSIACCGRGIGYIEPPLDKIHARLQLKIFVKDAALVAPRDSSALKGQGH